MDPWQNQHIQEHLTRLISVTECNPQLIAVLRSEGVLDIADIAKLDSSRKEGKSHESALLYKLLLEREQSYPTLIKALIETNQNDAAGILLEAIRDDDILDSEIKFLGNKRKLRDIFGSENAHIIRNIVRAPCHQAEFIDCFVTHQKIFDLARESLPSVPSYYIPRLISNRVKVNEDIFRASITDVFVFKRISPEALKFLVAPYKPSLSSVQLEEVTSRFIVLEDEGHWEKLKSLSSAPIHLINDEFDMETRTSSLVLEDTSKTPEHLLNYINEETKDRRLHISEDEFIENIQKGIVPEKVCICDAPGTGKSLLFASLANKVSQKFPNRLVALITLPNFTSNFDPKVHLTSENAIDAVLNYIASSAMAFAMLKEAVMAQILHIDIFFDGIDEVPTRRLDVAKRFLRLIASTADNIRIYVASLPQMRIEMEHKLKIKSYDIQPFDENNQVDLLVSYWQQSRTQHSESILRDFATSCVVNTRESLTDPEKTLIGIPLQCCLLGEASRKPVEQFLKSGGTDGQVVDEIRKMNISQMYAMFIDNKFKSIDLPEKDILDKEKQIEKKVGGSWCCSRKVSLTDEHVEVLQTDKKLKPYHVWKAVQIYFPAIASAYAEVYLRDEDFSLDPVSVGILVPNKGGRKPTTEFAHRTFAEFLVAQLFAEILTAKEQHPVINTSITISNILKSAFLLIPKVNIQYLESPDTKEFGFPNIVYFLNGLLPTSYSWKISPEYRNSLFGAYSPHDLEDLLKTAIRDRHLNLFPLIQHYLEGCDDQNIQKYKSYFCKILYKGKTTEVNEETMEYEISHQFFSPFYEILSNMVRNFDLAELKQSLNIFTNVLNINFADVCSERNEGLESPLEIACEKGNYELVEYFVDLDPTNKPLTGKTVYYTGTLSPEKIEERLKICKLLQEKERLDQQIMSPRSNGTRQIHLELLKYLLANGLDIRHKSRRSLVTDAAEYMSPKDFSDLVKYIVDMNASEIFKTVVNIFDWHFPVHLVLRSRCNITLETLQSLLEISHGSVNTKCDKGHSFLLAAVVGGQKVDVLRQLIDQGADYSAKDKEGRGVLHLAASSYVHEELKEIIELFVSKGISIDELDTFGVTPIFACNLFLSIQTYINFGAAITFRHREHGNILHHGSKFIWNAQEFTSFVNLILNSSQYTNSLLTDLDSKGRTPAGVRLASPKNTEDETLEALLGGGDILDALDSEGNNLLLLAVSGKQPLSIIENLISKGISHKASNSLGESVLHLAAASGKLETVKYFLKRKIPIDITDNRNSTPLLKAIEHLDIIKYLISEGASIKSCAENGSTIARLAVEHLYSEDFHDFVEFMIESKNSGIFWAEDFKLLKSRLSGWKQTKAETLTLLIEDFEKTASSRLEFEAVVDDLLLKALDQNHPKFEILKVLVERKANVNLKNADDIGLLHIAAKKKITKFAELLLKKGVSPNVQDNQGQTPLTLTYGNVPLIKQLLIFGADPSIASNRGYTFWQNCNSHCHYHEFHDLVVFCLEMLEDGSQILQMKDKDGKTPLQVRFDYDEETRIETIQLILNIPGYDINARDNEGNSLFLAAVAKQPIEIWKTLVENGADPKACLSTGENALHIFLSYLAIERKYETALEKVSYLLSLGVDVNQRRDGLVTPIHTAMFQLRDFMEEKQYEIMAGKKALDDMTEMGEILEVLFDAAEENLQSEVAMIIYKVSKRASKLANLAGGLGSESDSSGTDSGDSDW